MLKESVAEELRIYESRRATPLRLREYFSIGDKHNSDADTLLHSAQFIHTELPIRFARLIRTLNHLPKVLADLAPCTQVRVGFMQSFHELLHSPHPRTPKDEAAFIRLAERIRDRHANTMETMGHALAMMRSRHAHHPLDADFHQSLDRFQTARLAVSVLLNQYIAMHAPRSHWVGIMCDHTSPAAIADEVAAQAAALARLHYGDAPKIIIEGDVMATFLYIPAHLQHILFELLKNAVRATVETHGRKLPAIRITIIAGGEDISIRIADEGGGIPRTVLHKVFDYLFTTAPEKEGRDLPEQDVDPIAGLGHGLSVSRIYARYFGGDLHLESLHGYGTEAFLYLPNSAEAREVLL